MEVSRQQYPCDRRLSMKAVYHKGASSPLINQGAFAPLTYLIGKGHGCYRFTFIHHFILRE
jgi:hypothetical protein